MKHSNPQPLMTYSQWCTIFKHRLKKYIRRKLYNGLQWLLFILFHGRDSLWNDRTLAVFRLLITDQGGFHHDTRHKNRH